LDYSVEIYNHIEASLARFLAQPFDQQMAGQTVVQEIAQAAPSTKAVLKGLHFYFTKAERADVTSQLTTPEAMLELFSLIEKTKLELLKKLYDSNES